MKRDNIIKILSLALGLTIGIVLIGKIFYELSYDMAYPDADRIYRIAVNGVWDGRAYSYYQVSSGVVPGFRAEVPGVESATRLLKGWQDRDLMDEEGKIYYADNMVVDTSFFDVFSNEIIAGNPKVILGDPTKLMISRAFADILGGVDKALGTVLKNPKVPEKSYVVEGVYENFKSNGSIQPDVLYSMNIVDTNMDNWHGADWFWGFVKLQPGVEPASLDEAIARMQLTHQGEDELERSQYTLMDLPSIHRQDRNVKNAILILSIIAFLLISISIFNYILVVISELVRKSKEMGIRKCYGASAGNIYAMLFRQSLWQICIALIIAALLIFLGRNLIKELTGYTFARLMVPESIIAVAITISLVLIISVIIPARTYLSVKVDNALRGFVNRKRKWKFALLGMQLAINIFITVIIIIVWSQHKYVVNFHPGYNTENVLYIRYNNFSDEDIHGRIVTELAKIPGIEKVGVAASAMFIGSSGNNVSYDDLSNTDHLFNIVDMGSTTSDVFDIFEIPFIEGHKPTQYGEAAVSKSFVERMNNLVDWSDGAVGHVFLCSGQFHGDELKVTGVYDDVLIGNLISPDTRPSIFSGATFDNKDYFRFIMIKANEITPQLINEIQETTRKITGNNDLEVMVYRDMMKHVYDEFIQTRTLLFIGAAFSMLIALIGLIGFLNDESDRRAKEFAIRKINGASARDLFGMFYSSIIKLSLASAIVASIGAIVLGKHWLKQFAEKITLSSFIFIGGTAIILIIVTVVVMINSYRVVTANPTDSLHNE